MLPRCIIVSTVLIVFGCSRDTRVDRSQPRAAAVPDVAIARHTAADLQTLRYLEGDWHGSGGQGGSFFETYGFLNDSTIEMTGWIDSTMTMPREQSQYLLRDGVIRTSTGARLVKIDREGHHFQAASYEWTFKPLLPDRWTARVGPSTIYNMDRVPKISHEDSSTALRLRSSR